MSREHIRQKSVKSNRGPTPRRQIASRDPEVQALWAQGLSKTAILRRLGLSTGNAEPYFGVIDPTPQPLGCRTACGLVGETPEQRAFRRFPIDSHKPGP